MAREIEPIDVAGVEPPSLVWKETTIQVPKAIKWAEYELSEHEVREAVTRWAQDYFDLTGKERVNVAFSEEAPFIVTLEVTRDV